MARSQKKEDSIYDFLYVDAKRIGLLLSQFGSDGVLTELIRTTDATTETGGKFDIKIVGVNQKEGEKTGLTRKFDPQWLMPLLFLREAKDIIVRDIEEAGIGKFVLMSGSLSILDLSMSRLLWDVPFIQQSIAAGATPDDMAALASIIPAASRHDRRAAKARGSPATPANPALEYVKAMIEVVKVMPHGTFASISDNAGHEVFSTLRDDGLVVASSDLMLQHGTTISGDWNIVGVLDALPDAKAQTVYGPQPFAGMPLLAIFQTFGPVARSMLGRPSGAYGMTPLLIFREVGRPK
jgi:hypothetical protein